MNVKNSKLRRKWSFWNDPWPLIKSSAGIQQNVSRWEQSKNSNQYLSRHGKDIVYAEPFPLLTGNHRAGITELRVLFSGLSPNSGPTHSHLWVVWLHDDEDHQGELTPRPTSIPSCGHRRRGFEATASPERSPSRLQLHTRQRSAMKTEPHVSAQTQASPIDLLNVVSYWRNGQQWGRGDSGCRAWEGYEHVLWNTWTSAHVYVGSLYEWNCYPPLKICP